MKAVKSAPLNDVAVAVERMNEQLEVLSDRASKAAGEIQSLRSATNDAQVNSDEAIALRTEFGGGCR
jgi:methyl-accepting chemotaxis protein